MLPTLAFTPIKHPTPYYIPLPGLRVPCAPNMIEHVRAIR
ncbi:MAG: hypothetical protein RJB62_667 [Pseudomonadota bacterium]|jgi:hypothetical protein